MFFMLIRWGLLSPSTLTYLRRNEERNMWWMEGKEEAEGIDRVQEIPKGKGRWEEEKSGDEEEGQRREGEIGGGGDNMIKKT